MKRRTQLLIALLALILAAGAGYFVYSTFARMVTTAEVVTPATTIPAGGLITPDLLTTKVVPRPLLEEEIYVDPDELAGQVAVVPLYPGMVVYRAFAVSPGAYRLAEDPSLEVVSFPVDPAKAVGGQLQPGHRVDIWRLVAVRPTSGITITGIAHQTWATATLLVENAPVVDVRSGTGQPYARAPQAIPGQVAPEDQPSGSGLALQILTVAVPREIAQTILALVAEERAAAELWVTLAPLTGNQEVRAHPIAPPGEAEQAGIGGVGREEDATISPSPPTGVRAEVAEEGVLVRWLGTGDDRVVEYIVYREGSSWEEVTRVPATGDNRGEYEVVVEGSPGFYGVAAVDRYGNQSAIVGVEAEVVATPTPEAPGAGVIAGTQGMSLAVSAEPGGPAIGTVAEGTRVEIVEGPVETEDGTEWLHIRAEGVDGWVAAEYVQEE